MHSLRSTCSSCRFASGNRLCSAGGAFACLQLRAKFLSACGPRIFDTLELHGRLDAKVEPVLTIFQVRLASDLQKADLMLRDALVSLFLSLSLSRGPDQHPKQSASSNFLSFGVTALIQLDVGLVILENQWYTRVSVRLHSPTTSAIATQNGVLCQSLVLC